MADKQQCEIGRGNTLGNVFPSQADLDAVAKEQEVVQATASHNPYQVERDHVGCLTCGHGDEWIVVFKPTDIALGQSWGDKEIAEELAEYMNMAYEAGRESTPNT